MEKLPYKECFAINAKQTPSSSMVKNNVAENLQKQNQNHGTKCRIRFVKTEAQDQKQEVGYFESKMENVYIAKKK
jgi:acyl-CoA hydrolase